MYWLFENDNTGNFVVEAVDMEEAQEIAENVFPEEDYGESWCNPESLTPWEVDMEGYDVF